ncbi:meiotic recombination protein Dmc1-like protein [Dinothrombium tinctorium]|uniref:Meiotic recombination protein DMC1/LIM15 homolog n=1 Tax=Dinothrombium tinctorium TaxID=1965070 RepID=A0A3S3S4T2_9ACAR|nr:meiotic recombination protein Dmc1-like protein [Dinothrombium tinctorium]RWS01032.1 meiotic recombination protein Dmc1-like protein [Dinothrombium tinctorium]RWS10373.1 meiotic recombination protein Dmc1-like protein [Dinothrombium tinctorium]
MSKHADQSLKDDFQFDSDDDECFFQDIDLLQAQGINVADLNKLKTAGIFTIKGIQMMTRKKLSAIKGLSEAKVEKIKEAAAKLSPDSEIKTGLQVAEKRKFVFKVSTGSTQLDKLLGGGIESMAITEAFGEFRCGKTQLSHTLCVTCQISTDDYSGGKAMFIDTENTFRPDRLKQIASRFDIDEDTALENVNYIRAYSSEHQYEILDKVAQKFHDESGSFRLIVIDSIMALFRVDYSGRGELADRQQKLAQFMSKLQKLSEEYNVAVFGTNQMTADPGATLSFQADPKKPIGGHILAHASTVRIYLKKGRGETRIAKIYDAPDLPEAEATFAISEGGIIDAKE